MHREQSTAQQIQRADGWFKKEVKQRHTIYPLQFVIINPCTKKKNPAKSQLLKINPGHIFWLYIIKNWTLHSHENMLGIILILFVIYLLFSIALNNIVRCSHYFELWHYLTWFLYKFVTGENHIKVAWKHLKPHFSFSFIQQRGPLM